MSQNESLETLIALHLDGELSAEQCKRLAFLLDESEEACEIFWRTVHLHHAAVELADQHWGQISLASSEDSDSASSHAESIFPEPFSIEKHQSQGHSDVSLKQLAQLLGYFCNKAIRKHAVAVSAAAILAIACLVLILVMQGGNPAAGPTPPIAADDRKETLSSKTVAILTDQQDAVWEQETLSTGSYLRAGQRLSLTQGSAEITTYRGAVVVIEAPAKIEMIDNDNALHLHSGKLVGLCYTAMSKGFVVKTDFADIKDIGTEFGAEVSGSRLTTTVISGEIELSPLGGEPISLTANQTAILETHGNNRAFAVNDERAEGFEQLVPRAAIAESLRNDPEMIAYYGFEAEDILEGKLLNRAEATLGKMDGALGQDDSAPTLTEGRWLGTTALRFKAEEFDIVRIGVEDARAINNLDQFTIGVWVKPNSMDQLSHHFVAKRQGRAEIVLNFGLAWEAGVGAFNRNAVFFHSEIPGNSVVASKENSLKQESGWMHLVVTYDRGERAIYLDGRLLERLPTIGSGRTPSFDGELFLGASSATEDRKQPGTYLDGDLDELFILGRVMSAEEIATLHEEGAAP